MLVSIGSYDICDGTLSGGVAIGQLQLKVDRITDVVIPIGEADPVLFDRVGRTSDITFQVERVHADWDTASAFLLDLDGAIPSIGIVLLVFDSGSRSIPNALIRSHSSSQVGATTRTVYNISGGAPSGSSPPPPTPVGSVKWQYRPEIAFLLTADGTPALDGIVTVGVFSVDSLLEIVIEVDGSLERQTWKLLTGAADVGDGGQVAPLDYDGSTNNVHWEKVG
jgi:hypothetical protein